MRGNKYMSVHVCGCLCVCACLFVICPSLWDMLHGIKQHHTHWVHPDWATMHHATTLSLLVPRPLAKWTMHPPDRSFTLGHCHAFIIIWVWGASSVLVNAGIIHWSWWNCTHCIPSFLLQYKFIYHHIYHFYINMIIDWFHVKWLFLKWCNSLSLSLFLSLSLYVYTVYLYLYIYIYIITYLVTFCGT